MPKKQPPRQPARVVNWEHTFPLILDPRITTYHPLIVDPAMDATPFSEFDRRMAHEGVAFSCLRDMRTLTPDVFGFILRNQRESIPCWLLKEKSRFRPWEQNKFPYGSKRNPRARPGELVHFADVGRGLADFVDFITECEKLIEGPWRRYQEAKFAVTRSANISLPNVVHSIRQLSSGGTVDEASILGKPRRDLALYLEYWGERQAQFTQVAVPRFSIDDLLHMETFRRLPGENPTPKGRPGAPRKYQEAFELTKQRRREDVPWRQIWDECQKKGLDVPGIAGSPGDHRLLEFEAFTRIMRKKLENDRKKTCLN